MARKHISNQVMNRVLIESRRRCALCFGLDGDSGVKRGQVAHLDRDNENNHRDNLAFLCLEHHDLYDSRSRQSKGLTREEVLHYQSLLHAHIGRRENSLTAATVCGLLPSEFLLYNLRVPDSVCGFDYLAADHDRRYCFELSDSIVGLGRVTWEENQWLNCDYEETARTLEFPLPDLAELVARTFNETDFSLIAYRSRGTFESFVFSFGVGHRYYDLEFYVEADQVLRRNGGDSRLFEESGRRADFARSVHMILSAVSFPC